MGLLQEGKWVDRWYQTEDTGGRFVRKSATFRNWITADGSPGSSGSGGFKAEKGLPSAVIQFLNDADFRTKRPPVSSV